jgi:hypothetical protein
MARTDLSGAAPSTIEPTAMVQAHAHLGYAPRGVGLLYALLWLAHGNDVLGWFIGAQDGSHLASYFVLQDYYSTSPTRLLRSAQDDVYGPWLEAGPHGEVPVSHPPPIAEEFCHELSRLQNEFIRHWLFFGDDPQARSEAEALRARELAVRGVNVQSARLNKFHTGAAVWRYDAPGVDTSVLIELSKRWPLDFQVED